MSLEFGSKFEWWRECLVSTGRAGKLHADNVLVGIQNRGLQVGSAKFNRYFLVHRLKLPTLEWQPCNARWILGPHGFNVWASFLATNDIAVLSSAIKTKTQRILLKPSWAWTEFLLWYQNKHSKILFYLFCHCIYEGLDAEMYLAFANPGIPPSF